MLVVLTWMEEHAHSIELDGRIHLYTRDLHTYAEPKIREHLYFTFYFT